MRRQIEYYPADLKKLLEALVERAGKTLAPAHVKEMHEYMLENKFKSPFGEDYLYRKIYLEVKDADEKHNKPITLNTQNIEAIAKFLGFKSYNEFVERTNRPVHKSLENCVGSWYSYVRCNSGLDFILISPVSIYVEGGEAFMTLKGKQRTFTGKLKFEGNCIYCLLESKQEKNIHLVFSVGFSNAPNVLQGVFSGMSTAGDPIAGREVLIRQSEEFQQLKNSRKSIKEMIESDSEEEWLIASYFSLPEGNIIKARRSSTFDFADLQQEK